MGTRGYYVYRYRNMYFAYYRHCDSYPDVLGVDMVGSMRSPRAITSKREELTRMLDKRKNTRQSEKFTISSRRPQLEYGSLIRWIYEIDLDRNIFHINGIPFFNLECLPTPKTFLKYIPEGHYDNYGRIACTPGCLPKHKYNLPAPPVVDHSDLARYQACTGTDMALSDLLAISEVLSPDEQVRVSLLEVTIGHCMVQVDPRDRTFICQLIYDFELMPHHNQLKDREWSGACSMASFAFVPQLFDGPSIRHPSLSREEFTWVREDTVVCIATHLDDERCLQASISRLITAISEQKDVPGDYFGVAFSIYHCAIVKVVKDANTTTFSHTQTLQFLPSNFAESPSTPGITALARLAHRVDPALFVRAMEICRRPGSTTDKENELAQEGNDAPNVNCAALPSELWREIALHLDLQDVLTLGLISKLCREAASMVLRYPHVCGHRLVAVSKETPSSILRSHRFLHAASFAAARAGVPTDVLVGWGVGESEIMNFPIDGNRLRVCLSDSHAGGEESVVEIGDDSNFDEDEDDFGDN
ncbi:hypothetical protein DEU56DRAFT_342827 [Suillus clintonianus]|uniref:uncharacterized protein n=1 Tax=Suillus clintonianus TaxID=1904413 RepID=UPI001B883495|nr:uncharacterized protein DEU56DRAFT_342827 [Suillus clintonianus]KAG2137914.1 hypothetical protein DEU56DRAFT_342827 [Suillus clintonianus]